MSTAEITRTAKAFVKTRRAMVRIGTADECRAVIADIDAMLTGPGSVVFTAEQITALRKITATAERKATR
jgi:hypothetical protein